MDYQHTTVTKFWRDWLDAVRRHPGRTLGLLLANIVLASVLVVAVAFLSNLGSKLGQAQEKVTAISAQLAELKVDVRQAVSLKQEVSQTVNVITKVEREIADMKEAIGEFYNLSSGEAFRAKDKGGRVQTFTTNGLTFVYFELQKIPLQQSISITHRQGAYSPLTYSMHRNIVDLRLVGNEAKSLRTDEDFCFIRYHHDPFAEASPVTTKDMVFVGELRNWGLARFRGRAQQSVGGDSVTRAEDGTALGAPQP